MGRPEDKGSGVKTNEFRAISYIRSERQPYGPSLSGGRRWYTCRFCTLGWTEKKETAEVLPQQIFCRRLPDALCTLFISQQTDVTVPRSLCPARRTTTVV